MKGPEGKGILLEEGYKAYTNIVGNGNKGKKVKKGSREHVSWAREN